MINLDEKLRKAIRIASENYPLYSYTLDCLRYEWLDNKESTMSMNKYLILHCNRLFIKSIKNINDLSELVVHEILHYLLNHFVRYSRNVYKDRVPFQMHNIAMDFEINMYLNSTWIQQNGMLPKNKNFPDGLSYEEYLILLMNNYKDEDFISINIPGSIELSEDLTDTQLSDIEAEVDSMIKRNNERSQSIGSKSEDNTITDLISVKPKPYNWSKVINGIIAKKVTEKQWGFDRTSYQKYNRRLNSISNNILFPSRYDETKELFLIIGMDISSSMGSLTNEMYARLKYLMKSISIPVRTIILECDTEIRNIVANFDYITDKVNTVAGGGTDLNNILFWIENNDQNPDLVVIMTDNYCTWKDNKKWHNRTVVLTDKISKDCPYKQYEVDLN